MTPNNREKELKDITEAEKQDRKNGGLIRFLPSLITVSAFCVGLTSVRMALLHKWEYAILCILAAALLDTLDGRIARLTGQSSQFGAQFDSLSDLVCFGVAPAIILFLRSVYRFENIGWATCLIFAICCALRLARFNTDLLQEKDNKETGKYFKGVPAPAGAILALIPIILSFKTGKAFFVSPFFASCCLLLSGILMISCIKTFSAKMIDVSNKSASAVMATSGLLVICLITDFWLTVLVFTAAYLVSVFHGVYEFMKTPASLVSEKKNPAPAGATAISSVENKPSDEKSNRGKAK
ncbi:MAG: CDP-diacylglycerol--serine O-phosphatidyltransferase [Holosporaceae bacterium]|jgi:CDP-diacylglycerol--serine O-phosphatidyltransferase|nr:CDP-diacylglycerol--serine O-phosphatidyltransferase [Holosporaceae bacterium]